MSNNGKNKYTGGLGILVLAGLLVVGYLFWQHGEKVPPAEENLVERTISAAPLIEREVQVRKEYIGYVMPINDVNVRPYISGFVHEIRVRGGAEVKVGDVMVIIDQAEYKAKLDAAAAAAAQAKADLNNRSIYYQRMRKAGVRAVSKTELDNAEAAFLSAQAAWQQAEASRTAAQVNYDYTVIRATIDGMVGNVPLSKGDYVSPEKVLLSVIQYDPIRVVFSITDKDYLEEIGKPQMFAGETLGLKLADGSIYPQTGKVAYVDNSIDKNTDSIAVYADFANPNKQLVANAYVNVWLEKKYRGMVVRKDWVYLEPNGSYIYVAGANGVVKTAVDILSEYGNDDYILKNTFTLGEHIVLDKMSAKDEGRRFKIVMEGTVAAGRKD